MSWRYVSCYWVYFVYLSIGVIYLIKTIFPSILQQGFSLILTALQMANIKRKWIISPKHPSRWSLKISYVYYVYFETTVNRKRGSFNTSIPIQNKYVLDSTSVTVTLVLHILIKNHNQFRSRWSLIYASRLNSSVSS